MGGVSSVLNDVLGGDEGPTTKSGTTIPKWLESESKNAVERAAEISKRPYEAYLGNRYLDPSRNEEAAFGRAQGFGAAYQPFLTQAGNALQDANQSFTDTDISGYMNPYIDDVLAPAAREMGDAFEAQRNARNMNAAARGAFGGMRNEIGNQMAEQRYLESVGDLYAQGRGNAWDRATQLWQADRTNAQNVSGQYGSLANLAAGLRGNEVNTLLSAGGVERGISQQDADFDYGQFLEERDWEPQQLQTLLGALGSVPYSQTSFQQQPGPDRLGQLLGAGASLGGAAIIASSKNIKTDKKPARQGVLEQIAKTPSESWRYKGEREPHMGPYAEDFQKNFGLGDGKTINLMDANGVAWAGLAEAAERIKKLEGKANA